MNEQPPCADGILCAAPARKPKSQESTWGDRQVTPELGGARVPAETKTRPHVLVVEDDVFFRQLNTEVLQHAGYLVDAVEDGAAAWDALNAGQYDLLVTDNSMPNISGVELLRKLYASRMSLPVIMATGSIPTSELSRWPALQPAATLLKPYSVTELVRMVQKVLHDAHASTECSRLHTG